MHYFISLRKYQAATSDDLWRFLTDQGHEDGTLADGMTVKTIMDTWTKQEGYPLVTVKRNNAGSEMTLSQV